MGKDAPPSVVIPTSVSTGVSPVVKMSLQCRDSCRCWIDGSFIIRKKTNIWQAFSLADYSVKILCKDFPISSPGLHGIWMARDLQKQVVGVFCQVFHNYFMGVWVFSFLLFSIISCFSWQKLHRVGLCLASSLFSNLMDSFSVFRLDVSQPQFFMEDLQCFLLIVFCQLKWISWFFDEPEFDVVLSRLLLVSIWLVF